MEKRPLGDQSGIRDIVDIGTESQIEGGAYLDKLPIGSVLEVEAEECVYKIEKRDDGYYISGHPQTCPEPVKVEIRGSTMGGKAIKKNFVGNEMMLEFVHPKYGITTTSWISNVKEIKTREKKDEPDPK